jgi:hypothetical protein
MNVARGDGLGCDEPGQAAHIRSDHACAQGRSDGGEGTPGKFGSMPCRPA